MGAPLLPPVSLNQKTWYLYEDTELHLIHSSSNCPDAKIASKYNYLKSVDLKDGDEEQATKLDARAKVCQRCVRRERSKIMRLRGYKAPPGFR